jgi:hypothetical protein
VGERKKCEIIFERVTAYSDSSQMKNQCSTLANLKVDKEFDVGVFGA